MRRCLGASFAQFEMAVLKELVKRDQIRPANPRPERELTPAKRVEQVSELSRVMTQLADAGHRQRSA